MYFATSNRTYFDIFSPKYASSPSYVGMTLSVLADMDANDTAIVRIYQGGGSQQSDIASGGDAHFSGYLVC